MTALTRGTKVLTEEDEGDHSFSHVTLTLLTHSDRDNY